MSKQTQIGLKIPYETAEKMGKNQKGFRSLTQMAIELINAYCDNQAVQAAVRNAVNEKNSREQLQDS